MHSKGSLRLFLDTESRLLKDLLGATASQASNDSVYLLVGPEGGWTDAERQQARAAGYESAGLGTGILRAETAALGALSILSHLLGRQPTR